jgi:uncharacterized protein (DUF58 family)
LFGVLLVALLFAAINYGNNLVFALTFLLAGVGHAALLMTWRNLAGLRLTVRTAEPVFAGEQAEVPVALQSDLRRAREGIALRFAAQDHRYLDVPPGSVATGTSAPVLTRCRGLLQPGQLTVETRFPLALFRAWSLVEPGVEVLVYPVPVHGYPLPTSSASDGAANRDTEEGEEDFAGIRAYRAGDSLHRISWRTSARAGQLHSKEFEQPAGGTRWLDWQDVPAEEVETRLGILTAWVLESAAAGVPWGLRLPGAEFAPSSGAVHRDRCLAALARHGVDP